MERQRNNLLHAFRPRNFAQVAGVKRDMVVDKGCNQSLRDIGPSVFDQWPQPQPQLTIFLAKAIGPLQIANSSSMPSSIKMLSYAGDDGSAVLLFEKFRGVVDGIGGNRTEIILKDLLAPKGSTSHVG
jgi:hypothetical protein